MGIKTGIVTGQSIEAYRGGDTVRMLQVQLLGGNPETVEWFDITGEDTAPVNGDKVVVWNIADNYQIAIATKDLVTAAVNAGERKFYSRDSDGNVKASIYLKDDGTLQIDTDKDLIANVGGKTTLNSTGDVDLTAPNFNFVGDVNIEGDVDIIGNQTNDGTIDATGNISTEGDVSADGDVIADALAAAITLLTHFHQGNLGFPTGTPLSSGGGTTPSSLPSADSSGEITDGLGTKSTNHIHSQGSDSNGDSEVDTGTAQ